MKTTQLILALATLSFVACEGLSDEDIQNAMNAAEPGQQSTLNFKAGETWTGTRVRKEDSGTPHKFEGGASTPCDESEAMLSKTECGTPTTVVTTRTTQVSATVLGKSDTAMTTLPGWAVQEANTVTVDKENFYPVPGTFTSVNGVETTRENLIYTLGERNNFVIRLDGDSFDLDGSIGETLFPSHPQRGRSYTDDQGLNWTVRSATQVALASGTASAAAISATTAPGTLTDLADLTAFRDKCFYKQNIGGGNYRVEIRNACDNTLVAKHDLSVEVAYDLALVQRESIEEFRVTDYGVRDSTTGLIERSLPTSESGEIVFLFERTTEETTFTMTDISFP